MEKQIAFLSKKYVSDSITLKYAFESFFGQDYPTELIKIIVITSFNLINQFEINFDDLNNLMIIGRRGTKRMTQLVNLVKHLSKNNNDIIFFSTIKSYQEFYKEKFPKIIIHSTLEIFEQDVKPCDKIIIFGDDMIGQINRNNNLYNFIIHARFYGNIFLMVISPGATIPIISNNQDYVILCKEDSLVNKTRLWNKYGHNFPTLKCFVKVFTYCTNDGNMMVLDNRKQHLFEHVFELKINSNDNVFDMIRDRKNLIRMIDSYSEDSHT